MATTVKPGDGEQDLAILFPERTATIAGVAVTMREYGFIESLRLHAHIQPIVDALAALALSGDLTDPQTLAPVFGAHADSLETLIAAACDQPREWVASLDDVSGNGLQLLWWGVNSHFFGRRVMRSALAQDLRAFAGRTSTSHSPAPAIPPSSSASEQSVN